MLKRCVVSTYTVVSSIQTDQKIKVQISICNEVLHLVTQFYYTNQ